MLTLFVYDEILGFAARVENSSCEISHGTAKETLGRFTKKLTRQESADERFASQLLTFKFVMYS